MNKTKKFLRKLSASERALIETLMIRLRAGDWSNLDLKKLKGQDNLFRVRQGKIRIIFERRQGKILIIDIGYKNDTTYNF